MSTHHEAVSDCPWVEQGLCKGVVELEALNHGGEKSPELWRSFGLDPSSAA